MRRTKGQARRVPPGVWVLGFVSLMMDVSSELIHALLPVFLVVELGASALSVGLIEGVAESTALIVKVFSGTLSDYLGRRKILAAIGYGLGALSKPFFAMAPGVGTVFAARFVDRVGKGIRGAPRDALIADLTPEAARGAAFGLRQALDTVGALIGPLLAMGLMLLWSDDFRAVFWVATVPGALAVLLLVVGLREPTRAPGDRRSNPIEWRSLARLPRSYWWIVAIGGAMSLARFSEAFLVLRAQQGGLPVTWVPLVLIVMNFVYAAAAYPFGAWADRLSRPHLLAFGLVALIFADGVLALGDDWLSFAPGVALWGLHLGATQGLLSAMVADAAPADLRGTAFGLHNLTSGAMLLLSSAFAGLLWDRLGPGAPFVAGALFGSLALGLVVVGASRLDPPRPGDGPVFPTAAHE